MSADRIEVMRQPAVLRHQLTVLLLLLALTPQWSAASTLVFAASNVDRAVGRVAKDVVTAAYAQLNISVRFENFPSKRRFIVAEQGEVDGLSASFDAPIYNPEGRDSNLIQLKIPIAHEDFVVFSKLKKFAVDGYASLSPYAIGYVAGVRVIEQRFKDMRTDVAPSQESLFRKLDIGRTDVAVDTRSAICAARRLKLRDVFMLEPALETFYFYHYVHKRHRDLVPKLEAVLQKMKQDGSINRIQDRVERAYYAGCK